MKSLVRHIKNIFKKTGKWLLKYIIIPFIFIYVTLASSAYLYNVSLNSNQYAAILITDWHMGKNRWWVSPGIFLATYPQTNFYFNLRGYKTEWITYAKNSDLERVVKDDKYQSIANFGHGSYATWKTSDDSVTFLDVKRWTKNKKKGEWLQLHCGQKEWEFVLGLGELPKLGELALRDKSKAYSYERGVWPEEIFWDTLTGFKMIKKEKTRNDFPYYIRFIQWPVEVLAYLHIIKPSF